MLWILSTQENVKYKEQGRADTASSLWLDGIIGEEIATDRKKT